MGCCQGSSSDNELVVEKSNLDPLSFRPALSSDSDSKFAPTPSFGSGNKKFAFDNSDSLR